MRNKPFVSAVFLTTASLISSLALGRGQTSQGDVFSKALTHLLSIANNGRFESIKGSVSPDTDNEGYKPTILLPGARDCLLWIYRDSKSPSYRCLMAQGPAALANYDGLVEAVSSALGDRVDRRPGQDDSSGLWRIVRTTRFASPSVGQVDIWVEQYQGRSRRAREEDTMLNMTIEKF